MTEAGAMHELHNEPKILGVEVDPVAAEVWEEFAESNRGLNEMAGLFVDPTVTNPTIHQRALTVVTAPHRVSLPYTHPLTHPGVFLGHQLHGLEGTSLGERLVNKPELSREVGAAVLFWLELGDDRRLSHDKASQTAYHEAIIELLPLVGEDIGGQLYGHFPINDPEAFWSLDQDSGCKTLQAFLRKPEIPYKYKATAIEQWCGIARVEEGGYHEPREEHERAVKQMVDFLESWPFYGDGANTMVDSTVVNALIGFLESITPDGQHYMPEFSTGRVGRFITDPELRQKFAVRQLFNPYDVGTDYEHDFTIGNDDALAFVRGLRHEARAQGNDTLDNLYRDIIMKYINEQALAHQKTEAQDMREAAIQAKIRSI